MILVTGATGFLGRRLIKLLVKKYKPSEILCLVPPCNSTLEVTGRKILVKLKVKTKEVDLVTGNGMDNLPNTKLLFHLAANTEVLDKDHRVNDVGVKNLLGNLKNIDKNLHIVYVGTLVIFSGKLDVFNPINENTQPSPTNEYSRSKWRGELTIRDECKKRGFRLTILRPNTIYGSGGRSNGLFDTMVKLVKKDSLLARLNWPGKSSLVYVEDMAKALIAVSQAKKIPKPGHPELYMIDPEELSLAEIAEIFYKYQNKQYYSIKLPDMFWKFLSKFRPIIYLLENFMPNFVYNWLWRLSLITENVICCRTNKFQQNFTNFKFAKLKDHLNVFFAAQ